MPGEFLQQFSRVIGKEVLTLRLWRLLAAPVFQYNYLHHITYHVCHGLQSIKMTEYGTG